MSAQHQPHDGIDHAIIETLEANLNELAINRRCLAAVVSLSVDDWVRKVAQADHETLTSFLDLADVAEPVIHNMQSYLECLKTAQARLLNAFIQNQQRILDIDTAIDQDSEVDQKGNTNDEVTP